MAKDCVARFVSASYQKMYLISTYVIMECWGWASRECSNHYAVLLEAPQMVASNLGAVTSKTLHIYMGYINLSEGDTDIVSVSVTSFYPVTSAEKLENTVSPRLDLNEYWTTVKWTWYGRLPYLIWDSLCKVVLLLWFNAVQGDCESP